MGPLTSGMTTKLEGSVAANPAAAGFCYFRVSRTTVAVVARTWAAYWVVEREVGPAGGGA